MAVKLDPQLFNLVYPIVAIRKYPGGFIIVRNNQKQGQYSHLRRNGKRGKITRLSARSLSRLALTAQSIENGALQSMLTLTYGLQYPTSGKIVKYHLRQVLQWLNRQHGRYSYLWFLEFQRRGAPHLHVLLSILPDDAKRRKLAEFWASVQGLEDWTYCRLRDKKQFKLRQASIDVSMHQKTWELIRLPDGAKRYATKYALKVSQKRVPEGYRDVGRFWGTSNDLRLGMAEAVIDTDEQELREWLECSGHTVADWDILPRIVLKFDKA